MKIELKIDKSITEPTIVVHARELSPDISNLINKLEQYSGTITIIGYIEEKAYILDRNKIESIYAENAKVYARQDGKKYRIKGTLYELEELLKETDFVRISNSEIVNFNQVESLEIQGSSTIVLNFKSNAITYVARRYVSKIKEYLKI